jgi:hypothetical protein
VLSLDDFSPKEMIILKFGLDLILSSLLFKYMNPFSSYEMWAITEELCPMHV